MNNKILKQAIKSQKSDLIDLGEIIDYTQIAKDSIQKIYYKAKGQKINNIETVYSNIDDLLKSVSKEYLITNDLLNKNIDLIGSENETE